MTKTWLPKSMIKPLFSFLEESKFLPIELWNVFDIVHPTSIPTNNEKRMMKQYIIQKVGNRPGLYAYKDKKGHLLYVGKAKKLINRIFSHYKETFYKCKETDKSAAWPHFFSKYAGELRVYWIEVHGDREQRIIEEMIECCIGTRFDKEYPRGNRNISNKNNNC